MRIVGGLWRGRRLADVGAGDTSARLRPTSDRVREAMFNLLINGSGGDRVTGTRVLDLFAGTGALALEALSRGAEAAVLVDDGRAAAGLIAKNIALTGATEARHLKRDAARLGPCPEAPFDLVFLDPPYGRGMGERAVAAALEGGWIAPGATVVWEESAPPILPPGLVQADQRRYGETIVTICEAA